jgi:hypothetical protein
MKKIRFTFHETESEKDKLKLILKISIMKEMIN